MLEEGCFDETSLPVLFRTIIRLGLLGRLMVLGAWACMASALASRWQGFVCCRGRPRGHIWAFLQKILMILVLIA